MKKSIFILFCFINSIITSQAQSRWSLEAHGGQAFNIPMPLQISQKNYPDIKLTARYRAESFTLPVYWDLRLSRWKNEKSWELELIHHKLYLDNATPEVPKFNISHGFNMLMVNRGFDKQKFRYRGGVGIVIAHPESNIRGKTFGDSADDFDMGYFISGPLLNLAINKPIRLSDKFYLNTEAKTTFAYSYTKIADGHAHVYNLALHIVVGFGVDFINLER